MHFRKRQSVRVISTGMVSRLIQQGRERNVPATLGCDRFEARTGGTGNVCQWGGRTEIWFVRAALSQRGVWRDASAGLTCSTRDRDDLGEEGSNGRLGRSPDTRYGTRGPGSRVDRTPRHEDTVYLPATTVPPTAVALRPKREETAAREPGPLAGPVPRCQIPTMQIIPSNA